MYSQAKSYPINCSVKHALKDAGRTELGLAACKTRRANQTAALRTQVLMLENTVAAQAREARSIFTPGPGDMMQWPGGL